MLSESKQQCVQLESKLRAEMDDLYKKYVKACEMIKEFQQKWADNVDSRLACQNIFSAVFLVSDQQL